ncbi:hypothetical protein [Rhizobium leguminosarum]|uniref:hypothetical protein n=1 Tax=Rhizobium leguminosarum TaxID=384 RepID=UPI000480D30F|nr:hypothetical protein [Rhizobium leguminosarum]
MPSVDDVGRRNLVQVNQTFIVEIELRAWTTDGKGRRAAYNCLRERQDNAEVFRLAHTSPKVVVLPARGARSMVVPENAIYIKRRTKLTA